MANYRVVNKLKSGGLVQIFQHKFQHLDCGILNIAKDNLSQIEHLGYYILLSRIQNYNLESGTMKWKQSNIFSILKTQTFYILRIQLHSSNNCRDK